MTVAFVFESRVVDGLRNLSRPPDAVVVPFVGSHSFRGVNVPTVDYYFCVH